MFINEKWDVKQKNYLREVEFARKENASTSSISFDMNDEALVLHHIPTPNLVGTLHHTFLSRCHPRTLVPINL